MSVFAKYAKPNSGGTWPAAIAGLMNDIANPASGVSVDRGLAGSIGGGVFPYLGLIARTEEPDTVPKAYLNYIVFDSRDTLVDFGYIRVNQDAYETGTNNGHQHLFHDLVIRHPGHVYIYLSNENETPVDVFFDDFKIEHIKSPVIAVDDYYPFGLAFNSYSRENSVPQDYKYNSKEEQTELGLGWLDYGLRMYQPELGRWNAIDPLAEKYLDTSPFTYVANNPISFIDPNGAEIWLSYTYQNEDGDDVTKRVQYKEGKLYNEDGEDFNEADPVFSLVQDQLNSIKQLVGDNKEIAELFSYLEGEDSGVQTIAIDFDAKGNKNELSDGFLNKITKTNTTTTYNPLKSEDAEGNERYPVIGLLHELRHASDKAKGVERGTTSGREVGTDNYRNLEVYEARAVNTENILRQAIYGKKRTTYRTPEGYLVEIPSMYLKN